MIGLERVHSPVVHLMTGRDELPKPGSKAARSTPIGEATKRVAIVEDEFLIAWLLETTLEDLGHEVIGIFATGETALAAIESQAVDLVCMDINLGSGIDGIETAVRIRASQPTSIVFVSAYSDAGTRARVSSTVPGAILLGKPVDPKALEQAISAVDQRPH